MKLVNEIFSLLGPQPDNANAPEDCIALVEPEAHGEPSGKYSWHDVPCVYENDIVCEDDESLLAYAKKKFKIVVWCMTVGAVV